MKTENLILPPQLFDLAKDHFRLLKSENLKRKRDTVELRLSGYSDVMHLISDIVKVSILALGDGENSGHMSIPDPASNVSGVLSVILDLIPYEEAELLDAMRYSVLEDNRVDSEEDWDFVLRTVTLTPPDDLYISPSNSRA